MSIENRQFERYRGKEGAMAALVQPGENYYVRMGQIVDISRGGVAFEYVCETDQDSKSAHLELFSYREPCMYICSIPCTVAYESDQAPLPASTFKMTRCGVKFGSLSDDQQFQLQAFIENYSIQNGSIHRF